MKKYLLIFAYYFSFSCSAQKPVDKNLLDLYLKTLPSCLHKPFPAFSYQTVKNKNICTHDLLGKITLIDFWFEACPPCVAQIEGLKKVYEMFQGNKDFQFVSFTWDTKNTAIQNAIKHALHYDIISINEQECSRLNCSQGFPVIMIVDKTGEIIFFKAGSSLNEQVSTQYAMDSICPVIDRYLK